MKMMDFEVTVYDLNEISTTVYNFSLISSFIDGCDVKDAQQYLENKINKKLIWFNYFENVYCGTVYLKFLVEGSKLPI